MYCVAGISTVVSMPSCASAVNTDISSVLQAPLLAAQLTELTS